MRFSSWRRTLSSSLEWASPSSFLFRAPKHIVVLCGNRLAVVVCRKEYTKADLSWSRVHGSSVLRKVLSQRAADFLLSMSYSTLFFYAQACTFRASRRQLQKKKKNQESSLTAASDGMEVKSGASKAASLAFGPYISRSCSMCCAKSPLSISKVPVDSSLLHE